LTNTSPKVAAECYRGRAVGVGFPADELFWSELEDEDNEMEVKEEEEEEEEEEEDNNWGHEEDEKEELGLDKEGEEGGTRDNVDKERAVDLDMPDAVVALVARRDDTKAFESMEVQVV
jgi:hypothetical protein